jgi:hypothetical protein
VEIGNEPPEGALLLRLGFVRGELEFSLERSNHELRESLNRSPHPARRVVSSTQVTFVSVRGDRGTEPDMEVFS